MSRSALPGIAVLLVALAAAGPAWSGVSAQSWDQCTASGYGPGQTEYSQTDALVDGWMTWDVYAVTGTTFFACTRRALIIVNSDAAGSAAGSSAAFTGTVDQLRQYFRDNGAWLRPTEIINSRGLCYAAASGTARPWAVPACAGKPTQRLYGWYLGDSLPGYVTYQVSSALPRVSTPSSLSVPFKVTSAAGGGWLTMAYKGQQFWRQRATNFTIGQWYRATLPVTYLNEADPVLTVYLEGTTTPGTSVFIPSESTLSVDNDTDGRTDGLDNCITTANATQRDADGDGYGSICDPDLNNSGLVTAADFQIFRQRLNTADPVADLDGSGLVSASDYQIFRRMLNLAPGPSGTTP
jgi:hypothetical protein